MKILVLASNPKGTSPLRLDEEVREIDDGIKRGQFSSSYTLHQKWAVRPRDMRRALLDVNPDIVHFCGHGAGEEGLLLESETAGFQLIPAFALAGLFELFRKQVKCVILNACYSKIQAEAIAKHIRCVVGMSRAIGDKAAIEFSVGFYDALVAGKDIEVAFKFGCNALQLENIPESLTPILIRKQTKTEESKAKVEKSKIKVEESKATIERSRSKGEEYKRGLSGTKKASSWDDVVSDSTIGESGSSESRSEGYQQGRRDRAFRGDKASDAMIWRKVTASQQPEPYQHLVDRFGRELQCTESSTNNDQTYTGEGVIKNNISKENGQIESKNIETDDNYYAADYAGCKSYWEN